MDTYNITSYQNISTFSSTDIFLWLYKPMQYHSSDTLLPDSCCRSSGSITA